MNISVGVVVLLIMGAIYLVQRVLSIGTSALISFLWTFGVALVAITVCINPDGRNVCAALTNTAVDDFIAGASLALGADGHRTLAEWSDRILHLAQSIINKTST